MDSKQVTPITGSTAAAEPDQAALYSASLVGLVSAHALIDGCHTLSTEMLAFWQSRLKEGIATGQRLLECESPEGALEVQLDYAKAALQAYVDQSVKIGDLMSRSLVGMCAAGKPATSRLGISQPAALAA